MKIHVADIPEEGLEVSGPGAFDHPFQDPSWTLEDVSLLVQKEGEDVLVTGGFSARVPLRCGRCLEPLTARVRPAVDARFVPSPTGRPEEHELGADDLETDVYDNGVVDLGGLLETETSLELPMKPLCREDCRGLCPICGGNRNLTACACDERAPDPRWAALRTWAARQSK